MPKLGVQCPAVVDAVLDKVKLPDYPLIGCNPKSIFNYLHPDPGVVEVSQLRHPQLLDCEPAGVIPADGALGAAPG